MMIYVRRLWRYYIDNDGAGCSSGVPGAAEEKPVAGPASVATRIRNMSNLLDVTQEDPDPREAASVWAQTGSGFIAM